MTLPLSKIGYKGQRYAVCYADTDGDIKTIGWTNEADGGSLLKGAEMHPSWKHGNPRVLDLKSGIVYPWEKL